MKKIILGITTVAMLATSAFSDYSHEKKVCEKGYNKVLIESFKGSLVPENNSAEFLKEVKLCQKLFMINLTFDSDFYLKNQYGVTKILDKNSFCTNINRYTKHVYDRYQETNDIDHLYNYSKFVLRPTAFSSFESMKEKYKGNKSVFLARVQTAFISLYSPVFEDKGEGFSKPVFSAAMLAYFIAQPNKNFGNIESKLGYFDHEFQDFLIKILNKDFAAADKIIDKQYTEDFKTALKYQCLLSTSDDSL